MTATLPHIQADSTVRWWYPCILYPNLLNAVVLRRECGSILWRSASWWSTKCLSLMAVPVQTQLVTAWGSWQKTRATMTQSKITSYYASSSIKVRSLLILCPFLYCHSRYHPPLYTMSDNTSYPFSRIVYRTTGGSRQDETQISVSRIHY